jgi:hypothetical protein
MGKIISSKLFYPFFKKGCVTMAMKRPKGEHEKAMERAKHLLVKHVGMGEIIERTNLTLEEINKARSKM